MEKKLTPITPGDVLMEAFLRPSNISQNQLAVDISVPPNRISQIVHGIATGVYFGIEPEFWLNLQMRYNMKLARIRLGEKLEKEVKVHPSQESRSDLATA